MYSDLDLVSESGDRGVPGGVPGCTVFKGCFYIQEM